MQPIGFCPFNTYLFQQLEGAAMDPKSAQLLPTYMCRTLNPEPLELQRTHPGYEKDMWMTPLSNKE